MSSSSAITAEDLERRLFRLLSIPVPDSPGEGTQEVRISARLEGVRAALAELHEAARRMGAIPQGYPRHVDLVMRAISALLPWYTRGLVEFGDRADRMAGALCRVCEEIVTEQEDLARHVADLQRRT